MNIDTPGLQIDYTKISQNIIQSIKRIEEKPHARFIRYLLSKKYSPFAIQQNLFRTGLSAPHEDALVNYYLAVIDPLVKKHGIGAIYADYKNKLLRKHRQRGNFTKSILNYRIDIFPLTDLQAPFCRFIKELDIDRLWLPEIYRGHGSELSQTPVDEKGKRVLEFESPAVCPEKVLSMPKRYMIDKMILEGLPTPRIFEYCRDKLGMKGIQLFDIRLYKKIFFNIQANTVEEKIKTLEAERGALNTLLSDLKRKNGSLAVDEDSEATAEQSVGDKVAVIKQCEQRIDELDDNLRTLSMLYSDAAHKQGTTEVTDLNDMFTDIIARAYRRFRTLDEYHDRDVVDPLIKTTKIIEASHDHLIKCNTTQAGNRTFDPQSEGAFAELYKQRLDDIIDEQTERASRTLQEAGMSGFDDFDLNNVAGVEKLGLSFDTNEEDE